MNGEAARERTLAAAALHGGHSYDRARHLALPSLNALRDESINAHDTGFLDDFLHCKIDVLCAVVCCRLHFIRQAEVKRLENERLTGDLRVMRQPCAADARLAAESPPGSGSLWPRRNQS
jgi:hypothetical protein